MKLIQYTGPFSAGQHISIPAQINYTYVHIGIEIPYQEPIVNITSPMTPDIEVNSKTYKINNKGILEFDGLAEIAWEIEFLKDAPMESTLEIAYEIAEN